MIQILLINLVVLSNATLQPRNKYLIQRFGPKIYEMFLHRESSCTIRVYDDVQMTSSLNLSAKISTQADINYSGSDTRSEAKKHGVDADKAGKNNRLVCPLAHVRTLLDASKAGELATVKKLLSRRLVGVNCCDEKGRSALMRAALFDQGTIFNFLVQQNCDLSAVDKNHDTVMHHACQGNSIYIVKKLLDDHSFDIESRGNVGRSPLLSSLYYGNIAVCKFLLKRGADIKTVDNRNHTILHVALNRQAPPRMLAFLLSLGNIVVDSRGQHGRTPLMIAVETGRKRIVNIMIKRGADVKTVDDMNNNILHAACHGGHLNMVKYVLAFRVAEIDCRGHLGRTPLMFAVESGHTPVVKLLRGRGADVKAKDDNGLTVLHIASQAGQLDIVKYLVNLKELRGVEKIKTKDGDTPLQLAVKNGHLDIASFFKSSEK